jgi:hypothetical protein
MAKPLIDSEEIRKKLKYLIDHFEDELKKKDLRQKVLSLVPIFQNLRELGKSLISKEDASSARNRILFYFRKYPRIIINGDELLVVSAIQEYARRLRELRIQFGWSIINGDTAREMAAENEFPLKNIDVSKMKPDDYLLLSENEDRDAAYRWNIANEIRKRKDAVRPKILEYFKLNVGKSVTGEELRYVANDKTEWARRVRELRTEHGWPIETKNTGRPDLPVGSYLLESLRQSPEHDRQIPDPVRGAVLRRDKYTCVQCGWTHDDWNRSDPRHLELHHKREHAKGGENTEENLVTLCTICHDDIHRKANSMKYPIS